MLRDVLSQTDLALAPVIALCVFVVAFVAVVAWTMGRKRKRHFQHMNELPLADSDAPVAPTAGSTEDRT